MKQNQNNSKKINLNFIPLQFIVFLLIVINTSFHFTVASEAIRGAQKDYDSFKQELVTKMDSLDKKIEELREKTKKKGSELKDNSIEELEKSRAELKSKISQLESKSKSQWKSMKQSLSESLDSLHDKVQKALKD